MSTAQIRHYFHSRTGHLALTYLAIIMAMTIIFSTVLFSLASRQFDRPIEPHGTQRIIVAPSDDLLALLNQRAADARAELFLNLVVLNLAMLGFGLWLSTYLAGGTMEPIEKAMREQIQFVSDASHELRTPLTALSSLNEVVLRRTKKISDAEARELATQNMQETNKLYMLTSSLLGLVNADQQQVTLSPVDLQQAVSDAMEHIISAAQEKSIEVEDTTPKAHVQSQSERLMQVIKVLLENAVKYSHPGGVVRVYATVHGSVVVLHVADTGVGIAEQDMPHIFSRFYRADQSRNKEQHDGYGIGLAIAKSISDQLGMNLRVKSKIGEGSVFSIDLPLVKE